ncbi:glycoside hydrolase family 3 C-terminal domain-containing protein [candidate division KSB1 bacterium]|nr:glycoside hydrolase family 3 C-terminal domain-containing protein [candidate division KSB1 bacterium]
MKFFILALLTLIVSTTNDYKNPNASVKDRVNDILSQMTVEEKIDYIGGVKEFYIREIPRLGLPKIKMSDGPVGARNDGPTTAYPAGILAAATWDTTLLRQMGIGLGQDARARGTHILLGPGVNIYRAPMCGRNFEYFGEDPFLAGQLAVSYIHGVQSQGVAACVKHFAANNQEWDRYSVSSEVDERTLQEIYLPAFKAAVQQAKVASVMNSYNLLNGEHATQNSHLNNDILKNQWSFDGILMSDWGSTHDGLAAALGGLDLEMPRGDHMNRENLLTAIENGSLAKEVIDDKVRRILRIIFRFGFYDRVQKDSTILLNNPETGKIALELARNGIVLLKNKNNILPMNPQQVKSIAVIGQNATAYVSGGGSSWTFPFEKVTLVDGLKNLLGAGVTITYHPGFPTVVDYSKLSLFYEGTGSGTRGLKGEYFKNKDLTGSPDYTRIDKIINFDWFTGSTGIDGFPNEGYSVRWTGVIRPDYTKKYEFHVSGDDGYRLWVDEKLIIELWKDQGNTPSKASIRLEKGKEYPIKLEYYQNGGGAAIALGYKCPFPAKQEAARAARQADAAILCMGFNGDVEKEGIDRPFELPEGQDELIGAVAKANSNTVVVMYSGGNVDMQKWLRHVNALVQVWHPGQAGGTAIAEILFGKVNPGGKLPVTLEKKWKDNPVYKTYYDPDGDKKTPYMEGIYVGYRGYEKNNIKPQFPFGFGLSYTTFTYSDLKVEKIADNEFMVNLAVTNTGKVAGDEIVQLYVSPQQCSVDRPAKELKGFARVKLNPGESKIVSLRLDKNSFQFYHPVKNQWGVEPGDFELLIGASSVDIRLKTLVRN